MNFMGEGGRAWDWGVSADMVDVGGGVDLNESGLVGGGVFVGRGCVWIVGVGRPGGDKVVWIRKGKCQKVVWGLIGEIGGGVGGGGRVVVWGGGYGDGFAV